MHAKVHEMFIEEAPGAPGVPPTWSTSAKETVGGALGSSRVWFTVSHGIVNEVYYPRIDIPQIRDLGFIVADGKDFWIELKRLDRHELQRTPDTPNLHAIHHHERFKFTLAVTLDPIRDVLLLQIALEGNEELRPYVILAPHLGGTGHNNMAFVATYRGRKVLWAEKGPFGLALTAVDKHQNDVFGFTSAGYVGRSDGWQDFRHNKDMCWRYLNAGPGNVALTGALPCEATLALGFGSSKESAATLAISALLQPFEVSWKQQINDWEAWHSSCRSRQPLPTDLPQEIQQEYIVSSLVLRTHQDKIYPGAMVASMSVPWGSSRDERGGYHLVWPRDMAECAGALLAIGAVEEARNILRYLIAVQNEDGHWYQNQWLGGKPFWQGIQLDEAAFPILLATVLGEREALDGTEVQDMVHRAIGFIVRTGPASDQDRWEEDAGVNTFTLAVCIAALVAGAPYLNYRARDLVLAMADYWNAHIEDWTAVYNTPMAQRLGVKGYFIREAPLQTLEDGQTLRHVLPIKNRIQDPGLLADEQVGVDFLQLVRFGLRRADDPLILDSIKVVDALLKVDTPSGPSWHRYNGDGYGEHEDGLPFDGTGVGRAWPLLTGERGHYELSAGRDPLPYLKAMLAMSGKQGMIPEQIWDTKSIPERNLYFGQPSGSAMPLVWAHAEFIKLVASKALGRPFDRPDAVWDRYQGLRPPALRAFWCEQAPISRITKGSHLLVCLLQPGMIHWSANGWRSVRDTLTQDCGLGLFYAELDSKDLDAGRRIDFTFRYSQTGEWAGKNYTIYIVTEEQEAGGR